MIARVLAQSGTAAEDTDYLHRLLIKLGLSDFAADTAAVLIKRPIEILVIVVAAIVVGRLGSRAARRSVQGLVARSVPGEASARTATRAETLARVSASLVRVAIWTVAILLMADKVGFNLGPLLAGASIVGVAVGFGAQSLVRDFLSGFFVLAEDQFGVGDIVTVADITGTVEDVNLRVTRLRAFNGTVWYVPNGEIRTVGNSFKEWSRAVADVLVPTGADVVAAMAAIEDEVSGLAQEEGWAEAVLEPPQVLGVESSTVDGFVVRVAAKARPSERVRVARELRARSGARLLRDGFVASRKSADDRAAPAAAEPGSGRGEPQP